MTSMPPVALLAGGLATRLRPITEKIPKSLVEVAGEPFIAHQMRMLHRQGVRRVVVCAGFLGEMLRDFLGEGGDYGLEIAYSWDGPFLIGTGGAIKKAAPLLGPEFMILYGDSWLDTDYAAIVAAFRASAMPGLMTVFRNEGQWDTSNVVFRDGRIITYDKKTRTPDMHYIDWGLGLLRAEVLASWSSATAFDLADIYGGLVREGRLAGYEVRNRFYEIGSHAGLAETDALLRVQKGTKAR